MRVAAKLAVHDPAPDRRRTTRAATDAKGTLVTSGYYGAPVMVRDISLDGFRAEIGGHIPPQSIVRLFLPGIGMVIARIKWSKGGEVGGAFVNPVSPQRLMLIPGMRIASPALCG